MSRAHPWQQGPMINRKPHLREMDSASQSRSLTHGRRYGEIVPLKILKQFQVKAQGQTSSKFNHF